jgi:hypothetical protein
MSSLSGRKHYRLDWTHRTLKEYIDCQTKRFPDTLLFNATTKRHQKAVNPETGRLLGYARWNPPLQYIAKAAVWDPQIHEEDFEVELRQL